MQISRPARTLVWLLLVISILAATSNWSARAQTDEDPTALGALLYAENCAVCHGANGEGRIGATLAKDWPAIQPGPTLKSTLINGIPGSAMPAWADVNGGPLSDTELDALVSFILNWSAGDLNNLPERPTPTSRPAITPLPDIQGDPNQGAVLYDENCAVCHGANGEGRVGAKLAKDWPGIQGGRGVASVIANGIAGSQMPAWSQAKGGPLSDQQINNLAAYIATLPSVSSPSTTVPDEPASSSPLAGGLGIALFIILAIILLALVLFLQRRKS